MTSLGTQLPVALIVFRREDTTKSVLEVVKQYSPARLYVIADGPRPSRADDAHEVEKVRKLFNSLDWDVKVIRLFASENMGLKNRVLSGLDFVFSQEEAAIILEDDCVPDLSFFSFMEQMNSRYRHSPSVAMVSGNNFSPQPRAKQSYFFSRNAYIWGWMTWSGRWREFRASKFGVCEGTFDKFERCKVMTRGMFNPLPAYFLTRLMRRIASLDSWATYFAVHVLLGNRLVIQPKVNLVTNVGFGTNSTHTQNEVPDIANETAPLNFPLAHPHLQSESRWQGLRESFLRSFKWAVAVSCKKLLSKKIKS